MRDKLKTMKQGLASRAERQRGRGVILTLLMKPRIQGAGGVRCQKQQLPSLVQQGGLLYHHRRSCLSDGGCRNREGGSHNEGSPDMHGGLGCRSFSESEKWLSPRFLYAQQPQALLASGEYYSIHQQLGRYCSSSRRCHTWYVLVSIFHARDNTNALQ